jgi:hypothetical protein
MKSTSSYDILKMFQSNGSVPVFRAPLFTTDNGLEFDSAMAANRSKKKLVVWDGPYLIFIDPTELSAIDPRSFVKAFAEK